MLNSINLMTVLTVIMCLALAWGIVAKLRIQKPVGWVILAVAVPWVGFILWKYRMGPYVSFNTALIDSLPVGLFFLAVALLLTRKSE